MSHKHNSTAREHFNKLVQFRQAAYESLGAVKDVLFELSDAVIGNTSSQLVCRTFVFEILSQALAERI